MQKVEEYFVIELGNSREDLPDFLQYENNILKWISINSRAGNPQAQKEIALHKATSFKSEKEAKKLIEKLFGKKFNVRITRHFRYI